MAHKETFHLPSVRLDMDFAGDELRDDDLKAIRTVMKSGMMKSLIADGVAFQERLRSQHWKMGEGTVARVESVLDAWILASGYTCSKEKANQGGKVRWALQCTEPVTILMEPNE